MPLVRFVATRTRNFLIILLYPESPVDYVDPGMITLIYSEGSQLPAEECVNIATNDDSHLEGNHDFSLNVFDTSLGSTSPVTIFSLSSTTTVTINDDDGEIVY